MYALQNALIELGFGLINVVVVAKPPRLTD
jgi:hypothetical protein